MTSPPRFRLGGSVTALATPFRDGAVDEAALAALCERQIARGTTALVLCGSTGEAPALRREEQAGVIGLAVTAAAGRVPVIAGCGAQSTRTAAELAELAAHGGATALLCAPPAYVKPTQEGLIGHMRAIAHAADLPVVLYDVPARVGVAIADDTVATLFERGLAIGIKDATADLARPPRLRAKCGPGLVQMSGDDATAAAYRAAGGDGCISVTANLAPALCALLHRAWDNGDLASFARARDLLAPVSDALFAESNPIPLKAALSMLDLATGEMRLPLTRASRATRERLAAELATIASTEEALAARSRYALASDGPWADTSGARLHLRRADPVRHADRAQLHGGAARPGRRRRLGLCRGAPAQIASPSASWAGRLANEGTGRTGLPRGILCSLHLPASTREGARP